MGKSARRLLIAAMLVASQSVAWHARADINNVLTTFNSPRPQAPAPLQIWEFDEVDELDGVVGNNLANARGLEVDSDGLDAEADDVRDLVEARRERAEERVEAERERLLELRLLLP